MVIQVDGPPTYILSMIRILSDEIRLAHLILSLAETLMFMRSMSMVPVTMTIKCIQWLPINIVLSEMTNFVMIMHSIYN